MKRSLFNTRGKLLAVLFFVVMALFVTTVQNAYATTYTTMDAQGNIIQSQSLSDAVALSRATGRPIALDPGHSDGTDGRDPGAMYYGLKEGDIAWATAMYVKKYLEQWGVPVVVVRGEHEDPSLKTRVQRAVDANACAIISLHYNAGPASATGSEVLVPHDVSYNHDLFVAGQALAGKINYYLREKAGIVTRGDGATERGYNDKDGTDYYENGDESDYYGIVRYARQKGILGVIVEHQFISNPAHAAEFKDLGDNSKVDYIGWADAWAIWEMYHSDTWWSMSSISAVQNGNKVTVKPVLTGVVTGATFTFGYTAPDGSWTTVAYKTTDTSISFVPPMTGNYVLYLKAISSDGQEITRQMNFEATEETWSMSSISAVQNGNKVTVKPVLTGVVTGATFTFGYTAPDGSWTTVAYKTTDTSISFVPPMTGNYVLYLKAISSDGQEITRQMNFEATEGTVTGWKQVANGWMYTDDNGFRYTDRWLHDADGWHYFGAQGIAASGWITTADGKTFYADPSSTHNAVKLGQFTVQNRDYYADINFGVIKDGWVNYGDGNWAWANPDGSLYAGWKLLPNGKTWYFDPTTNEHAALIGLQAINGSYYYFDLGYGLLRNQDITLSDGRVVHADASGVLNIKPTDTNNGRGGNVDGNNGGDNRDANNTPADDGSPIEPTRGNFSDRTSVLGAPLVSKEDLQRDFNKRVGSAYPAVYAEKGAATGTDFVNQLWQAAIDEGVRPELLYAQVMIETGNLRFGGDVLPEQCNFGGLGAIGNGERGLSFDTVLKGLRAQALHLRAYAGYEPLTVDPSKARDVDPRYGSWILAKKANIIRKLAGTWAMDKNYAVKLVRVMNEL